MSRKKMSDNSGNSNNSNNKDKIEPIKNKKTSNGGDIPIDDHKYMKYLGQNEKQKFNKLMKTSGLSEDELVADAISQFTKRRSLGKKEQKIIRYSRKILMRLSLVYRLNYRHSEKN